MQLRRSSHAMVLGLVLIVGCTSETKTATSASTHGGAPGAGSSGAPNQPSIGGAAGEEPLLPGADESWSNLNPGAGIDIAVCAAISANSSSTSTDACAGCCSTHSYLVSGFINQGNCTCANPTPPDGATCASKSADGGSCLACCTAAGYLIDIWVGGNSPSCTCDARVDKAACRAATLRSNPSEQCAICCINHGYFNATYSGGSSPECACMPP